MKTIYWLCLVLLTGRLTMACTTDEPEPCIEPGPDHTPTPTSPQKGYVTGLALSTDGKPIAGATIVVNNTQFSTATLWGAPTRKANTSSSLRQVPGTYGAR